MNTKPSTAQAVAALCEFASQEFGLYGVEFQEVMEILDGAYDFVPTRYTSGHGTPAAVENEAGTNSGSCKVFAFAKIHGLDQDATLRLFCEHYQQVLGDPEGATHLNVRNFMTNGWDGIVFDGEPLVEKGAKGAVDQI